MKLRKIFAAVMACSIVCGAPAVIGAYQPSYELMANAADIVDSGKLGDNISWQYDSEGTLTISGKGEMERVSVYPWRESETIKKNAKKIVIEEGVTTISNDAFMAMKSVESVELPNSLKKIGEHAFYYCKGLKNVVVPKSVTIIGNQAFFDAELDSVTINNPNCEIYDAAETFATMLSSNVGQYLVRPIIFGYKGSTAEAYAEKYGYGFKEIGSETTATTTITTTKQTTTTSTTTTTTSGKATTTTAETTTTTAAPTTTEGTTTTTDTTTTATTAASTSSTAQPSTTSTAASTTAQPTTTTTTSSSALDSRFVGKWELYKYEVDGAYTSLKPDGFELFANGEGTWSSGGRILWTVVDEFLYIEANDGNLPININRYKYINGELLWSGWTQVVDNIAPETEKYAMNFYGKSENIYFRRVEDSEQTTTATTTTTTTSTTAQETTTTATAPVNEVSLGDPTGDGKIDAKDATFVLVEYAKLSTGGESELSDAEKSAADVNKDGKADAKDASAILSYYAYVSTGGTESIQKFV